MKNSLKYSRYFSSQYSEDSLEKKCPSLCAGCNYPITDQYFLRVAPDLEWHSQCLKCFECGQSLDETVTCFVLHGKTFCKYDYIRLFISKCVKCHRTFSKDDLFIRSTCSRRYHVDCFRCDHCDRLLTSGDEYYLHRQEEIFCRQHYPQLSSSEMSSMESKSSPDSIGLLPSRPPPASSSSSTGSNSSNPITVESSERKSSSHHPSIRKDKTTRMRTVLNEKQLLTLRTCYGANPRPDALMKEQLVEMTQLSPRVIRVWFQNKRCKDKKKTILAKQTQEQQKVLSSLNHGIPLVASSPVPNDINVGLPSPSIIEIQYHPGGAWKALSNQYTSLHHYNQQHHLRFEHSTNFLENPLNGFASEDDSNCFDASQLSEGQSETSCDESAASQLTLL